MSYDVIIVGGGAAGLTAAVYTGRRNLNTLILSQDIGGQAVTADMIENYPGRDEVDGPTLMMDFLAQAKKYGAEFKTGTVTKIEKKGEGYLVKTNTDEFETPAIILSFGLSHRHLGVPGEEELTGKGVAYCATCDAPLYKGKITAVVGGGNSALDAVLLLAENSPKVYLIHRRDKFTGENVLIDQVKANKKIEIIYNAQVEEIHGDQAVEKLALKEEDKSREIEVEGVFIEVGYEVKADFIKGLINQDEKQQIEINKDCHTNQAGIFAAGDVTNISFKQIVISAGEGAKAALSAHKYLQEKGLTKGGAIDWGKKK